MRHNMMISPGDSAGAGLCPPGRRLHDLLQAGGELRETHISWVYLTGSEAYKIKKPVELGFLDFSSLEKRLRACRNEVLLNQRLAPGIYLGLVPVTVDQQGHRCLAGQGETVDWAVRMVRLPDRLRADQRLRQGRFGVKEARRIARHLADFHSRAETNPDIAAFGSLEVIRANLEENFAQTRSSIGRYLRPEQVNSVERWQRRFLDANQQLFHRRIRQGRIRDCHGDLRLEHVYLSDDPPAKRAPPDLPPICIIDCIEFNQRFRYSDVCSDVAFLAMDLAWHGHADLAELFLAAYARRSNDFDLYPLVDFYQSYRAFLRAKVSSMMAQGSSVEEVRQQAEREARRYYLLALACEQRPLLPASLVAVGGLMAAGKSTIAEALSLELAAPVIDSDRTRKFMLGRRPLESMAHPAWQGAYAPGISRQVYKEVFRRAEAVLSSGRSAVIDASFHSRRQREHVRWRAGRLGVPFLFVECRPPRDVCLKRLERRSKSPSVSDGRADLFDAFSSRWAPVREIPPHQHVVLDTSLPLEENLHCLRRHLTAWPHSA